MQPGLYIVGTPIGNLQDICSRALEVLRTADFILAEDTRHTRRLLKHYQIDNRMISCHRFNEYSRAHWVVSQIKAGRACALVSNAGMPGISDPGARVTSACLEAGLPVTAVPGPSAVTTALAMSGFGGGGYVMEGFLPRKTGARRKRLAALSGLELPVVVYESPYRLVKLLDDIGAELPGHRVFLARELTKMNEEAFWGMPDEIKARIERRFSGGRVKGEIVLVISTREKRVIDADLQVTRKIQRDRKRGIENLKRAETN